MEGCRRWSRKTVSKKAGGRVDHRGVQIYYQSDSQKYMEKDRLAMVFSLEVIIVVIIIVTIDFYCIKCLDLLKINNCCVAQERRQFHQQHSQIVVV